MAKIIIDKNIEVTKALPFKPFKDLGGFSLGFLTSVKVKQVVSADTAKWEFAGHTIPRLEFEFIQWKSKTTEKDRFFTHGINPVQVSLSTGDPREEAKIVSSYEEVWKQIKHIHDCFIGTENYKELEISPEFDPELSVEDRLKEFNTFFEAIAKEFNKGGKGKSLFLSTGGKDKLLVMKLIVSDNSLRLPGFVGRGIIEKADFADGKLNTSLFFTPSETSDFDEAKTSMLAGNTAGSPSLDQALPDDVLKALKG